MKKLISLLLAAMPAIAFAQEKYVIEGKIGNLNQPARTYLSYVKNGQLLADSSGFKNGAFHFSGEIDVVTQGRIVIIRDLSKASSSTKRDVIAIYLANGITTINSPDSIIHATVTGTKANEDEQVYERYMSATSSRVSKAEKDSLFIASHPDSYVSLQLIKNMGSPYANYNRLQPAFNMLSAEIRNSHTGTQYQDYLNTLKSVNVNEIAPDFTQPDTSGKPVKLSSFRGKYVLIDFWASWCHPCREENPNVVKAYNQYKAKNFTVLGVSLDAQSGKTAWLTAIQHDGLTWTNVCDLKGGWNNEAVKLYGIGAIPQNLLLDPNGKIIAKNLRGDELQQKLAQILN